VAKTLKMTVLVVADDVIGIKEEIAGKLEGIRGVREVIMPDVGYVQERFGKG